MGKAFSSCSEAPWCDLKEKPPVCPIICACLHTHTHTHTHTHKYLEVSTWKHAPQAQHSSPEHMAKWKKKKTAQRLPIFTSPFFFTLFIHHLLSRSVHLISIDLLSEGNVSGAKVTRGQIAVRAHTAFGCLIQSDKCRFCASNVAKRISVCVQAHTHPHSHPRSGLLLLSKVVVSAIKRREPAWCCCPRSWPADVAQELSTVLKPALASTCCAAASSLKIIPVATECTLWKCAAF